MFIIAHSGGKRGFVDKSKMVFLVQKLWVYYHDEMDSGRSVSYTHLDVYKRQVL